MHCKQFKLLEGENDMDDLNNLVFKKLVADIKGLINEMSKTDSLQKYKSIIYRLGVIDGLTFTLIELDRELYNEFTNKYNDTIVSALNWVNSYNIK